MARHGVDFETVKQAALKLLSKGISPSVQRIRELLGTGSNSTIAEHLKIWREQHTAKKVHHLPASIPEELINTFEVLWQTAMEHAEQHLSDVKESLNAQEEKLNQEKIIADKNITDLKVQLDSMNQKMDEKARENQTLQTNLAVANERFQNQTDEINALKQQHELRLKHFYDEKNLLIDGVNKLNASATRHKNDLVNQEEKYRTLLAEERVRQEESEKRWIQLIDQARTEKNDQQKLFENTIRKQNDQIDKLQSMHSELQKKYASQQSTLNLKNARINELSEQHNQIQIKYLEASTAIDILQERLNYMGKKAEKFKNKNQPELVSNP